MRNEFTCIECPLGCAITAEKKGDEITVTGNRCARGKKYVIQEMTDPRRTLTTTVFVENGIHSLLPVRSDGKIPRDAMGRCVRELSKIKAKTPVKCGDVIAANTGGTGVAIIASRDMVKK